MNQLFSRKEIDDLAHQLKRGIRQSRDVLAYANQIQQAGELE